MRRSTLSSLEDEDLVHLAVAGDKAAFAEVVRRHEPTARSLAARLVGDPDLAGDVVQEAVVVALVGLGRLRTPERFGPWLCGIALNIARRWAQRARRTWSSVGPPAAAADPQATTEANDLAARVRDAVAELAPAQRDAVLAFYLRGLTHREVADELGVAVGTVKSRLHAARGALAPRLGPLVELAPEERRGPTPGPSRHDALGDEPRPARPVGDHEAHRPTDEEENPAMADTTTPTDPAAEPAWADATIAEIRRGSHRAGAAAAPHVVVLREVGGTRELPIWVGAPEATSLALTLEGADLPRPMTFQLTSDLLTAAGGRVREVRVTHLADGVFYATIGADGVDGPVDVDARPSDALNLAAITGAPIRVGTDLFDVEPTGARADWRTFEADASTISAEHAERMAELRAELDPPAGRERPT